MKKFTNVFIDYNSSLTSNKYIMKTLLKTKDYFFDFVVVDNSENMQNFEELSTFFTDKYDRKIINSIETREVHIDIYDRQTHIFYVRSPHNLGFGSGNNLGIKIALQFLNPDYIVISCNDMECIDDYINLEEIDNTFTNNSNIGLIGVSIQNLDGSYQSPCRYVSILDRWVLQEILYPFSLKLKKHSADDIIPASENAFVYRVRGSFMIITPNAFIKSGGFDEKIFLYCEEPILSERLLLEGYSTYYLKNIHMLHNHISKNITSIDDNLDKLKQRFKSELYFYRRYKKVSKFTILVARLLFKQYYYRVKLYLMIKYKFIKYT